MSEAVSTLKVAPQVTPQLSPQTQSLNSIVRHNWNLKEVQALFAMPFSD